MPNPSPRLPNARSASPADRSAVVRTIVRAFIEDPLVRWFFPDDGTYEHRAGAFFGYLFDIRVPDGSVLVAGDCAAAALWAPPEGETMPETEQKRLWRANVEPGAGPGETDRLDRFDRTLERLHPTDAHWYLGVLGTDPDRRGEGLARAVLSPVLARADGDGMPVLLETGASEDLAFYERFGFGVRNEVRIPGGPPVWVLHRPAASAATGARATQPPAAGTPH